VNKKEIKYTNGKIKEIYEVSVNELGEEIRDGKFESWYENGVKESEGEYMDNVKFGYWKFWTEKGDLKEEGEYYNDGKTENWKTYPEINSALSDNVKEEQNKFTRSPEMNYNGNNTVPTVNIPNQNYVSQTTNASKSNIILGISGGALVLILAIILIFMLAGKNDESDLKSIKKENVQTQESNTRQNEQQSTPPSQQNNNYGYPGRYPEASMRNLTYNELLGYSKSELRIMRNEIYARHGRIFQSSDLINYFSSQSWYTPLYTDKEVQYMLTQIEKNNITTIQQAEKTAR